MEHGPAAGRTLAGRRQAGFTLVELIVVMTLLLVVVSIATPSLGRFFRGRSLDSEAHRLLALTRYGQNRAVSEGVPMILWLDEDQGRYGLQAEFTYTFEDEGAREFKVDEEVAIEVAPPLTGAPRVIVPLSTTRTPLPRDIAFMRFTPAGVIASTSPDWVRLSPRRTEETSRESSLWVARSIYRTAYELRTNEPPLLVRR